MEEGQNSSRDMLITDWFRRVRESQMVHYRCANHFARRNYMFGIPTMALTTAVGTAVFASLDNEAIGHFKIVIGMISILAAVLSSLQTFLGFAQRADKHKIIASSYGGVRRQLEMLKTFPPADDKELKASLEDIKKRMDELAENAPDVPKSIWDGIVNDLKGRTHHRIFHLEGKNETAGESKL